jgi:activating signal cointegrator 1
VKVLSVRQPWAQLLVTGQKRFETRSWHTHYRGPLAIHASQTFGPAERKAVQIAGVSGIDDPDEDLPRGAIVGIVQLVDSDRTDDVVPLLSERERAFGNFAPGRFAWRCEEPRKLRHPIVISGRLNLWEIDDPVVVAQLARLARSGERATHVRVTCQCGEVYRTAAPFVCPVCAHDCTEKRCQKGGA